MSYVYSNQEFHGKKWTEELLSLNQTIQELTSFKFNSALINYYRDGNDSIGFHSDDEKELGQWPLIVSLSFGAPREFIFRHKRALAPDVKITLSDGVGLIMAGHTQENWEHGIKKTKHAGERINMTFRTIR